MPKRKETKKYLTKAETEGERKMAPEVGHDLSPHSRRMPAWMLLLLCSSSLLALIGGIAAYRGRTGQDNKLPSPQDMLPAALSTPTVTFFSPRKSKEKKRVTEIPLHNIDQLINKTIVINSEYGVIGGKALTQFPQEKATRLIRSVLKEAVIASAAFSTLKYLEKHNEDLHISFYAASPEPIYRNFALVESGYTAKFMPGQPDYHTVGIIILSAEHFSTSDNLLELCAALTNEFSHFRHTAIMRAIYHHNPSSGQKKNLPYVTEEEQEELHAAIFQVLSAIWQSNKLADLYKINKFNAYWARISMFNVSSINKLKDELPKIRLRPENQALYQATIEQLSSEKAKVHFKRYASLSIPSQELELVSDVDSLHAILRQQGVLTDTFTPLHDYYASLADKYLESPGIIEQVEFRV